MREGINDERILIERLKKGDTACFEILYRKYSGRLYNFVLNISKGDLYLAEEIVQNTFLKIWEIRHNINTEGSFSSFIYTIGKNLFLNAVKLRTQEYLYNKYVLESQNLNEITVDKDVDYKLLEERINWLIDQLPPARKEIYILSKIKNLPNKEIASMLNISENTVDSQLYKASRFLKKKLSQYSAVLLLL
ncbi:MAG: RNA polymerase sigma-70 factor [Paludibacter sp.]|nr:RNA polymerase sigma-70 factor [Paludibacter sp.]MDD4198724.1 RNA polymerase sigma-70 factor [Paludibacter sp.]MDD4428429.1 RNA polymerase sigma-70 factor [Paludibacter sp.]